MYGWQGVKALCDTIAYAKSKGMFVITDGKRNDIGTTMEAYATAHLGHTDVAGESIDAFGADALTVNGYLGTDGIKPLAKICDSDDKGIFVLVKTSNPSSGELQDMKLETNESVFNIIGTAALSTVTGNKEECVRKFCSHFTELFGICCTHNCAYCRIAMLTHKVFAPAFAHLAHMLINALICFKLHIPNSSVK